MEHISSLNVSEDNFRNYIKVFLAKYRIGEITQDQFVDSIFTAIPIFINVIDKGSEINNV